MALVPHCRSMKLERRNWEVGTLEYRTSRGKGRRGGGGGKEGGRREGGVGGGGWGGEGGNL